MKNYIAFFDKDSLMKLMAETGYSIYQIMEQIEPCSYLDTSGRALTPNFMPVESRYIDFYNVMHKPEDISDEEKKLIIDLYNSIGIKRICEETSISIRKLYILKLCKSTRNQLYSWRSKAMKNKKVNDES